MANPGFISVFTPSRTPASDLEYIFVQREALLADAVERVRESATTQNKHHLLFVGPRGCGKTHLITLLAHRLSQQQALADCLEVAWLHEEETSTSLLEFLLRIYRALCKRNPVEYAEDDLEAFYDLTPQSAETALSEYLLNRIAGKTLLVLVENLDALFESLGETELRKLRAYIQEHPHFCLVATAQKLVDDISKRKNTFFGFFQIEYLQNLSVKQATQLLHKIAELQQQHDLAAFLHTPTGKARMLALHHLAGGNHRIYIVLSQFISRDNIDALLIPFSKMLDEMTPYYQERIRWLPPQQRKIVELLCNSSRPLPVKALAKRLFASQQSISSQLAALREKGYVQSMPRGRESLYEISEPLMRLCVEIKENQSGKPLMLLVDFLRVWYDGDNLQKRLQTCDDNSPASDYLQAAIDSESPGTDKIQEAYMLRGKLYLKTKVFENAIADINATPNFTDPLVDKTKRIELLLARGEANLGALKFSSAWYDFVSVLKEPELKASHIRIAYFCLYIICKHVDKYQAEYKQILESTADSFFYPLAKALQACLAIERDHWQLGLADLDDALRIQFIPEDGIWAVYVFAKIIDWLYKSKASAATIQQRVAELSQLFNLHQAGSLLSDALINHLASIHKIKGAPVSVDYLEQWACAWEIACRELDSYALTLRLFRTGIDFLKSGATDFGILLDLHQEERKILRQAFELGDE